MDDVCAWVERVIAALTRFSSRASAPALDLAWHTLNLRSARDVYGLNQVASELCDFVREVPDALPNDLLELVPVHHESSFHVHLLRLEASVRKIGGAPRWTGVVVTESPLVRGSATIEVQRSVFTTPRDYALEFESLVRRGYPRINLNAMGLLGTELVVVVEHAPLGHPGGPCSVELSGPEERTRTRADWQLGDRLRVVE